jgi:hypothetical protein
VQRQISSARPSPAGRFRLYIVHAIFRPAARQRLQNMREIRIWSCDAACLLPGHARVRICDISSDRAGTGRIVALWSRETFTERRRHENFGHRIWRHDRPQTGRAAGCR